LYYNYCDYTVFQTAWWFIITEKEIHISKK